LGFGDLGLAGGEVVDEAVECGAEGEVDAAEEAAGEGGAGEGEEGLVKEEPGGAEAVGEFGDGVDG
jgi:hypothetical protein